MGVTIVDQSMQIMDPIAIFGKDFGKVAKACKMVMRNSLRPYERCYRAENRPKLAEIRETIIIPEGSDFITEYRKVMAEWYWNHPDEEAKEKASRKFWEEMRNRQFRIIYGTAKRHGLFIKWCGESCPDQFEIFRHSEFVGRIHCM